MFYACIRDKITTEDYMLGPRGRIERCIGMPMCIPFRRKIARESIFEIPLNNTIDFESSNLCESCAVECFYSTMLACTSACTDNSYCVSFFKLLY